MVKIITASVNGVAFPHSGGRWSLNVKATQITYPHIVVLTGDMIIINYEDGAIIHGNLTALHVTAEQAVIEGHCYYTDRPAVCSVFLKETAEKATVRWFVTDAETGKLLYDSGITKIDKAAVSMTPVGAAG